MKKRKKRSRAEKWIRRRERKIDQLRWKHRWVQWLGATDRLRKVHLERVKDAKRRKKRLDKSEMSREVLKAANVYADRAARILHLEGSPAMRAELDKLPRFEVFHGLAGDKRSFGTYDYVIFGTVTSPERLIQIYTAPFLLDGNGRKKFLRPPDFANVSGSVTRLAAILDRRMLECGYKLPTDEWTTAQKWLDKHNARSYDLHGHPKKVIVVIDRETP